MLVTSVPALHGLNSRVTEKSPHIYYHHALKCGAKKIDGVTGLVGLGCVSMLPQPDPDALRTMYM